MKKLLCVLYVLLFVQVPLLSAKELSHNGNSIYEEFVPQYSVGPEQNKNGADGTQAENGEETAGGAADIRFQTAETDFSDIEQPQDKQQAEKVRHFFLTDEKHARFLQKSEEYALADSMLNHTWKLLVKTLSKKEYRQLWKKHKAWLSVERDAAANSFLDKIPDIPEEYAYMLTAVAKTQELAQKLWHSPIQGNYAKNGLLVAIVREDGKFFVQGYGKLPAAESGAAVQADSVLQGKSSEKPADSAVTSGGQKQLLFRAEIPAHGKLWLALTTVSGQKLFLLTAKDALCLVHSANAFPLDFNGVFAK